jgi:hypothetical protein
MKAQTLYQSGGGLPHSKTWRRFQKARGTRGSVLECGSRLPLSIP